MDLKTHLSLLTAEARDSFARECGSTYGHLRNVSYGYRPCAPELAVLIEQKTDGAVTRKELRDDWQAIWPELADKAEA